MFWLQQLFRVRRHLHEATTGEEDEMSIIDHLEELRRTIIRMVLALVAAMIICFSFADEVMNLLRYPVDKVWEQHESNNLPPNVAAADWVRAKQLAGACSQLPEAPREPLSLHFPQTVRQLAKLVPILRAAQTLPANRQMDFICSTLPDGSDRRLALALYDSGAVLREPQNQSEPALMGAFRPGEAFMLSLQLSFFCGLILSFPLLMYFLLRFVIPGLFEHERRLLCRCVVGGFVLFLAGCAFAYFGVLPRVLSFFYSYSLEMGIANDWRIGYYLTFAAKLIFMFGLVFELPVIIIPTIKLGLLTYNGMKKARAYAFTGCFGVALFLAPAPDPATMFIMALPMYILYELCILFAYMEQQAPAPRPEHE